jgi:formimidoylglutamate deiminase
MRALFTHDAWLPTGWAKNVRIEFDASGTITAVAADAHQDGAVPAHGPVVPAMPNLHSHAFQRAIAGLTERRGGREDSFWTWRETMYRFAERITPEDAYTIAAQLYVELARAGYSAVAEFHYVQRMPDGRPYANPAEMALALVRAARDVGLAITILPVVYMRGGFDGRALAARQRRFETTPAEAFAIGAAVRDAHRDDLDVNVGIAPHSLRAVDAGALAEIVRGVAATDWRLPVHIHIAEQRREVEDSRAATGAAPIEWLLANAPVDERWCLVHATHASDAEIAGIATSGAVAGLCPTTEANLGDGLFALEPFLAAGGRIGIGSDSNVSRSPVEELRWLEYGQRLRAERRNVAASEAEPQTGARLWRAALTGGAQALGRRTGAIAPGLRGDLLVLDETRSAFAGLDPAQWLDALVFSGSDHLVRHSIVSGRWIVRDGHHAQQEATVARFKRAVARLRAD